MNVLLALILCTLLFSGAFLFCAYAALRLLFSTLNLIGFGGSSLEPKEVVLLILYLAGGIASFFIHPYGAYLVSPEVLQITSSEILQNLILIVFASFQFTMLASVGAAFSARKKILKHSQLKLVRIHNEVVAKINRSHVDVIVTNARVISDDGIFVLAEIGLQIKNVPVTIPYYEMNIHDVGHDERFFTAFVRQTNQSIANPGLKVRNADGKWIFYDIFKKRDISDNADNLVLTFEFTRIKAERNELPKTITPRLGIWARDDKVYFADYLFFYKPIPVTFDE